MVIRSLIKFILKNPVLLVYRINRAAKEFYRAGFVSTAISEGLYDALSKGPVSLNDLQTALGAESNPQGLEAWLDLGVSLGELAKDSRGYRIKGAFSKALLKAKHDTWKAFFQSRVEIFYNYIIHTPGLLKENKYFEFSQSYGELFARSSRTVEPILMDVVDKSIPRRGACRLLEVGCGSGIYIKRACDRNPSLTAKGLELQENVAEFARKNTILWQIDDRVMIETMDIQHYRSEEKYDIVTFYNLIYYFPLSERIKVLRHLGGFLSRGGRLILTTLCPVNEPSIQLMNLWSSMTQGCGPLPHPEHVCRQLKDAGFQNVHVEKLIPGFFLFNAEMV